MFIAFANLTIFPLYKLILSYLLLSLALFYLSFLSDDIKINLLWLIQNFINLLIVLCGYALLLRIISIVLEQTLN